MITNYDYDVIIIGAGPGGYIAALRAAELGMKVACIEKEQTLGGTCLNVGCIPSKALLESSERYDWLKKSSGDHGLKIDHVTVDFTTMMNRKETIVKGLVNGISALFKQNKVVHLTGEAQFIGPHTLEVVHNDQRQIISGNFIVIATGSEPIQFPFLPFDEKRVVSSTGILSLKEIPQRLLVVGAGAIGVELASVYQRLGSQVTIVEMLDRITPAMDSAISKQLLQSLKKQGMEFLLSAKVKSGKVSQKEVSLTIEHEQKELTKIADVVLIAVGRRPYTKNLGLNTVGIALAPNGLIVVNDLLQTTLPHVYALGDVIEGPMLAHKASYEGVAVIDSIAGLKPCLNYISIPNVIYTHPEAASVGLTEAEAKTAGIDFIIGTSFFRGNARARCTDATEGFVKVIGEKSSNRLIGMHIIGTHASELIAEAVIAIEKRATIKDLANACHPHPTLSETIMEACQQAISR